MYKLNIQYGQAEPYDDGMVLPEAGEEMADVPAAAKYWFGQDGVSGISISKTADDKAPGSRDI